MSSPNHPTSNIEDVFSSNFLDYTPTLPDYFPVSLVNISPDPLDNLSKYLLASLAISHFHDDPYMQSYNAAANEPLLLIHRLMSPKRTSTSATPTMTQSAIRKLVADSIAATLEEVANIAQRLTDQVTKHTPMQVPSDH
ncbi:hypothetical protein Tco_0915249 [Tanacetum coccineum]